MNLNSIAALAFTPVLTAISLFAGCRMQAAEEQAYMFSYCFVEKTNQKA